MAQICHRIVQVTDLHLAATAGGRVHGIDTRASAAAVLDRVRAWAPQLVIATGDLTDTADPVAYERLFALFSDLAIPVISIAGNHDDTDRLASAAGQAAPSYMQLGAWRLVFLDSSAAGRPDGILGHERLAGAAVALGDGPALVFVHHHPVPVASPWIDAMGLEDGAALMDLLEGRGSPTVVACGHVHQAVTGWQGSTRWLTTPSTCSQAKPFADRFIDDDLGPGFRWFELRDDGRWESGIERLPEPAARVDTT